MFPDGFSLGFLTLHPMGIAWAFAFVVAFGVALFLAHRKGVSKDVIGNVFLLLLVSSYLGGKAWTAIVFWDRVVADPGKFFASGLGSSGVLGAVLFSFTFLFFYLRRQPVNPWEVLDVLTPSWALIVAFGRLGCFASGCCYGVPTDSFLGVVFPAGSAAGQTFPGINIIPTQLFAAMNGFVAALITFVINIRRLFPGLAFSCMLIIYGLSRFGMDFYRHYSREMLLPAIGPLVLTISQLVAVILVLAGAALATHLARRSRKL